MDTCTTKNDSNLGPKRAKLVGMVGFSTLLKSEEGNARVAPRDIEADLDPLIARERR